MLVALYRENQAAFINNNMNLLKTGQILKVPSAEDVQKIAAKEANTEYRTHVADWNNYRGQVAGGVASLPARTDTGTSTTGKVASAAVAPPAPPAAESKDVLKLSKSEAAGKAGAAKGGGGAQDRMSALQEELTAKDKALANRQLIEQQFRASYLSEFETRSGRASKPRDEFSRHDLSSLELSLVAEDDLDETLPRSATMARSPSTKWSSMKTYIGSATSEVPRASSSGWPSRSA